MIRIIRNREEDHRERYLGKVRLWLSLLDILDLDLHVGLLHLKINTGAQQP